MEALLPLPVAVTINPMPGGGHGCEVRHLQETTRWSPTLGKGSRWTGRGKEPNNSIGSEFAWRVLHLQRPEWPYSSRNNGCRRVTESESNRILTRNQYRTAGPNIKHLAYFPGGPFVVSSMLVAILVASGRSRQGQGAVEKRWQPRFYAQVDLHSWPCIPPPTPYALRTGSQNSHHGARSYPEGSANTFCKQR